MSYKTFCLVLLIAVLGNAERAIVHIPQEVISGLFEQTTKCITETGVEPDIIDKILTWNFEDNEKVRKFMYCALKNTGFGNEKGHYVTEKMIGLTGNHKLKDEYAKAIDECNKIQGSDEFDTVYRTTICLRDTAPIWLRI